MHFHFRSFRTVALIASVVAIGVLTSFPSRRALRASGGDTVSVWVTTGDRAKLLEKQPDVTFIADSGSNPLTIDVDPSVTYQTMDGFGASFSDSSAWLVHEKMSPAQRDDLMQKLFDPELGIGLSFLRQPISASDFALGNYTYDDRPAGETDLPLDHFSIDHDLAYIIPVLQQAKALNPDLKIMGTPWSAPGWMKTNDSIVGGSFKNDPAYYEAYAQFFVKYIQGYQANGLTVDMITPQNEPLLTTGYPSMILDANGVVDFIGNHLGPAFQANGINTKIIVWDFNWDNTTYAQQVLGSPLAGPFVAGTAWHCYSGNIGAQTIVHNAFPGKDTWFTECSGGQWSPSFALNLRSDVRGLVIGATRQWAKSVAKWNIVLDESYGPTNNGCQNCAAVATVSQSTGGYTLNDEYYSLGHASKFVRPGAVRIDSNTFGSNAIEDVAFQNADGSKALIVLNTSTVDRTFKIREAGMSFEYTLPGGSVATFKWAPGATPTATPTATASPTPSPTPANQPHGGTPWAIPGTIQAEDYDDGGEGIAYHDRDAGNNGHVYRDTESVDIGNSGDSDGTPSVAWTDVSEWLKYTVMVDHDGDYDLSVRLANGDTRTGSLNFELDGVDVSGAITVPMTGGWSNWLTVTRHGVHLGAGLHQLRLIFDTGTPGNVNFFTFAAAAVPTVGPYGGTPAPIPGIVQAEDFDNGGQGVAYYDLDPSNNGGAYRMDESVDIEASLDGGSPIYNVGWTSAGEYLTYSIDAAQSGTYSIAARVASNGNGGAFHLEVDGVDASGPIVIPNTGGWNVWQSQLLPDVVVSAGPHTLKLVMDTDSQATGGIGNFNYLQFALGGPPPTPTTPSSTPYSGSPAAIPGRIQIEEYDLGGEGVAYHDASAVNEGNQYGNTFRTTEGVDTESATDLGGGWDVGFTLPGEWMKYTVSVGAGGNYTLGARVATQGGGAQGGHFHVEMDGTPIAFFIIPNTGGWQNWTTVSATGIALSAGTHVMKVALDSDGTANFGNLNWVEFTPEGVPTATPTPTPTLAPYGGTPAAIPGTIQAEEFDLGGEGVAYHDSDGDNHGAVIRTGESVEIETTTDTGGGYDVGWTGGGEWLKYTVDVTTSGTYTVNARVAAQGGGAVGGTFHLEIDGSDVTGPMTIPDTTGWQVWQTISVTGVQLLAGPHVLKLAEDTGGANAFGNFNWLSFDLTAVATPTNTPTPTATATETPTPTATPSPTSTPTAVATGNPWNGTAQVVPGTIIAAYFDLGGEGVAYHDLEPADQGSGFRTNEGVDTGDSGEGVPSIGWTSGTEWLKYTVNINDTGSYTFKARVASAVDGGNFHLEVDDVPLLGVTFHVPNTNGWSAPNWADINTTTPLTTASLTAGAHVVKLAMDGPTSAGIGNIESVTFSLVGATPTPTPTTAPYGGTPWAVPGKIEVENFDVGGEGAAYHDSDFDNHGAVIRTTERVEIETTTDTGGGYDVGWTSAGEWLKYTVDVSTTGTYTVQARVAADGGANPSVTTAGIFHLDVDGTNITGPMTVPNTHGWQTWATIEVTGVSLAAGSHVLTLFEDTNGATAFGNFNWLQFVLTSPTPTPTPTATSTPEPTATSTPEPTATSTPEPTATSTPEPTATSTPEPTATSTPEPTATSTPEPTATSTPGPTATETPTATSTPSPTPTPTNRPLSLNPSALHFSVLTGGTTALTPSQWIEITVDTAWTASSDQSFAIVSPTSGTGSGSVSVQINPALLPVGPAVATITITAPGSSGSPQTVSVDVATYTSAPTPFGDFQTPLDGATGLHGAVAVTGWALDAIGINRVEIYRDTVAGDPAPGPNGKIFIGNATLVAGARPDVAALFPTMPFNTRAAWGYMLLTNMLPDLNAHTPVGGNGTFKLYASFVSEDGQKLLMPPHTITVDNQSATQPFGTIDIPDQGATVSGQFENFGWVLTPQTATIPTDGSTIQLFIDGALQPQPAEYNLARPDIAALFPGYQNTSGPVAHFTIDTTTLANGVHTIFWIVTDNQGHADGIGSRFFTVQN